MKQQKVRFQRYIVAGKTEFPTTMLYCDESFPLTVTDGLLIRNLNKPTDKDNYVQLGRYVTAKRNQPRATGWKQFGWRIVKYSVQEL